MKNNGLWVMIFVLLGAVIMWLLIAAAIISDPQTTCRETPWKLGGTRAGGAHYMVCKRFREGEVP